MVVGRSDLLLRVPQNFEQVQSGIVQLGFGQTQPSQTELFSHRPFVERELNVERLLQRRLHCAQRRIVKPLRTQRFMVDERRLLEAHPPKTVGDDVLDLHIGVAEPAQSIGDALIDDLEVPSPGQLLELHQSIVRFDAGRVAVHDQPDGPRRRDHRRLRIAVSIGRAELQRAIPGPSGGHEKIGRALDGLDSIRHDRQTLIHFRRGVVGRTSMVANDPQHMVPVPRIALEGPELRSHLRRGSIGLPCHDRADGAANGQRLRRVIGDALSHQHRPHIGVPQPERPIAVALLRDRPAREGRHQHTDLQHDRPEPHRVPELLQHEFALGRKKLAEVQRRQVTRSII